MNRSLARLALIALLAAVVTGCSGTSTKFAGTWLNPDYTDAHVDDVLVIAVAESDVNRRIYESALVEHLQANGVTAHQSAALLPSKEMLTKEEVVKVIEEKGIDAVLVSRLVDINEKETYVPPSTYVSGGYYPGYGAPYYGSYYGYYSTGYSVVTSPGYTYTDVTVTLETNLYDAKTEAIAWSGQSQTFNPNDVNDVITPTTRMIVDKLIDDGLVDPKKE